MTSPRLRCAIYTRKSSEEGLEQNFNSLHAQREACEAYVLSQKSEGWITIRTAYDDGGFSGGSMDRPALKALLAEIEAGRVDVVVVYKVDRLTRSLIDFARIVEAFDRKGVSFVSVTQSFNTTTSMGRLTLNVLLSFAQFEREVTGERIRDKIAASKAKGIFMGGVPALGYDIGDRKLVVNQPEAEVVRHIFQRYLQLGTVGALRLDLARSGIRSKSWTARSGRQFGGHALSRGALYHLLKNRLFLGEVVHKGAVHAGEHEPILERDLFDRAQAQLARNARQRSTTHNRRSEAPLGGLVFDDEGAPMGPCFGHGKGGKVFRYYVSTPVQQGLRAKPDDNKVYRISAPQFENLIADRLDRLGCSDAWEDRRGHIVRIDVRPQSVRMQVRLEKAFGAYANAASAIADLERRLPPGDTLTPASAGKVNLTIDVRPVFRGGRTWLVNPQGATADGQPRKDKRLISGLRQAHAMLVEHNASPLSKPAELHKATGFEDTYARKAAQLAFLAPDIQVAILEGRQPAGLTFTSIFERGVPLAWDDQRAQFGFPARGRKSH
jgi:site-specific DNA recombinase